MIKLLLDRRGSEVQITEDIIIAVAGNRKSGEAVIRFLFNQRRSEIQITEDMITAAVENE